MPPRRLLLRRLGLGVLGAQFAGGTAIYLADPWPQLFQHPVPPPVYYEKIQKQRRPRLEAGKESKAVQSMVINPFINDTWEMNQWEKLKFLPSTVAAVQNLSSPILRNILDAIQIIPVDREVKESRRNCVRAIIHRAHSTEWPPVLIFPEATTTNGKAVITFKKGAFNPGLPVQPTVITYPHQYLDPSWVAAGPDIPFLMLRMLVQIKNKMKVEYLPVYYPNAEERADPALYARNVQRLVASKMGVPVTEHSYEDVRLCEQALELRMPAGTGVVEMEAVKRFFNTNIGNIQRHMETFADMDRNKDGTLCFEEFKAAFTRRYHPPSPTQEEALWDLFNLLDAEESGKIEFREYLVGLALVNEGQKHSEDVLRYAFNALDENGDGRLSRDEVHRIMARVYPGLSIRQIDRVFDAADVDKNGSIDWEEFKKAATEAGASKFFDLANLLANDDV